MNVENEFQKVKREQELQDQIEQERERNKTAHRNRLIEAIITQQQAYVSQWTQKVGNLLDGLGQATWGSNGYTVIAPNGAQSLSWFVVHQKGKSKFNYEVTLQFEYKDHNDLSLQPNDRLINPLYFIVKGKESYRSELSGESLKNTLLTAYKDGAKDNGLDAWAESVLMVSPYKKNENDGTNPWIIVPLVLTIFFGFSIFGFGFFKAFSGSGGTLFGLFFFSLLAMVISILGGIGLWRSFFGTKFKRLEPIDKIAVIIALIPGYFFALIISGGLIFVVLAIFAAIGGVKREDRISEIEEGVRRGLL